MSQFDFGTINPDLQSGTQLASDMNRWRDALHSMHRGSTRPTYAVQGMMWIDDSTSPWLVKMYSGTADTTVAAYNATTGVFTPVLTDLQVTTAKLAANAVTPAKLSRTGTAGQVLTSGGAGADPSYQDPAPVVYASSAENAAGTIENKAVDPLGIREAFNATGSAPVYACRAWVNFNGTGTVAIRASGNVSSITDNGTGNYTINFTTDMLDVNYNVVFGTSADSAIVATESITGAIRTTSAVTIRTVNYNTTLTDTGIVSASIFR